MMLPGVELARRRRVHHGHEVQQARDPQDLTAVRRPSVVTAMDESAVIARQRLEEKLRRFSAPPSHSSSSSLSNLILSKARRDNCLNLAGANNDIGSQRPRNGKMKRRNLKELCAVCLDDLVVEREAVRLPCSHEYHSDCLRLWLTSHSQCPSCRTVVASCLTGQQYT